MIVKRTRVVNFVFAGRQKFQAATTGIKTAIEIERELEINFKATLVTSIYFV